jgi:hypothetical protein
VHFLLLLLRLIHIVGGILWVGFALFLSIFLAPVLAGLGPDGGRVMAALQRRGLMNLLPLIALATILSGAGLMWWVSGRRADFVASPMGMTLALGALSATVAFFLGVLITRPAAVRMSAAAQRLASATPEERERIQASIGVLQRRVGAVGRWIMVLLILAASAMAVARYL